jgi:hypothetical protein
MHIEFCIAVGVACYRNIRASGGCTAYKRAAAKGIRAGEVLEAAAAASISHTISK